MNLYAFLKVGELALLSVVLHSAIFDIIHELSITDANNVEKLYDSSQLLPVVAHIWKDLWIIRGNI